MDLRYDTALVNTNTCDVAPTGGSLGIGPNARLIAPGAAADSVLPVRMSLRNVQGMPPLGSDFADTAGVSLINSWIDSLANCN
jgi:hypothetical protein